MMMQNHEPTARHLERARGLKVVSVQYGPWVEAGTAVDRKGAVEALRTLGHLGVRTIVCIHHRVLNRNACWYNTIACMYHIFRSISLLVK